MARTGDAIMECIRGRAERGKAAFRSYDGELSGRVPQRGGTQEELNVISGNAMDMVARSAMSTGGYSNFSAVEPQRPRDTTKETLQQ